jgi:hypothetical protein
MISRTYICMMPDSPGVNLDIAVRNAPGTRAAPVGSGGVAASAAAGAYYEWRGRPIVFPNPSTPAASFVPRARLGWRIAVNRYGLLLAVTVPPILLSDSIVDSLLDSTDAGGIINAVNLVDPSYGPTIRLLNDGAFITRIFAVHFDILEPTDEDRDPNGV